MNKYKLQCSKAWLTALLSTNVVLGIFGCSSTNTNTADIPKPPQNFGQPARINNPPPMNKNTEQSKFESQTNVESYIPFTKVEETREDGGTVTQIKVNNRGSLPSYYIYPNQQQTQIINNQQLNIAAPTWQLSW